MKRTIRQLKNAAGFSLMEILIAITLLAIVGTFVTGQFLDRLEEGKVQTTKIQIRTFKGMLEDYRRYCSEYPVTAQGLDALVAKPTTAPECPNYPASAFIKEGKVPKDPWDQDYIYESDGKTFTIMSYGKDRKEDGEGFDADIKSQDI